jgi:Na+-driven multidrug efflux pump
MSTADTEQDLVKEPIPKLIKLIAWPAAIGFFFNTMYNVVDTWVAGQISGEALAALSLTFPVFFIIIAISMGIGTGVTVLITNELGAGQKAKAKYYATQAIIFGVIISLLLTIIGYLSSPALFKILGAEGSYLETCPLVHANYIFGFYFLQLKHDI